MTRSRPSRRELLAGASAVGSVSVLGCLGLGDDEDDPSGADDDTADDGDAGVDVNGRSLRSNTPIELVEPDATVRSGFATRGELVANIHGHGGDESHWHFAPLEVSRGEERTVRVRYLDANIEELPLGPDEEYGTEVELLDPSPEDFLEVSVDGELVTFVGEAVGDGELRFDLLRDGETVWESPPLPVEVIDPETS